MTEFVVLPSPGVVISDADVTRMPLLAFHLVVIVEPDPESYMVIGEDFKTLTYIMYQLYEQFDDETYFENPEAKDWAIPEDVRNTEFIWIRNADDSVNFFDSFAESAQIKASFNVYNLEEDVEHLLYYLKGVAAEHPEWRVAVIGATIEDEVVQAANLIHGLGFSTSVILRYCLSRQGFTDLDALFDYDAWIRTAGTEKGFIFTSWLDDWMGGHSIDPFDNEDLDEDDLDEE